ncbi:MAG: hypothetical protein GY941_20080 [Planctomycetes bacterium]|nr:hypothetical protein [Planctomycetota bacterium]
MTITKGTIRKQVLNGDLRSEGSRSENLRVDLPACECTGRWTEIAYKAKPLGEGAQHSEVRPENMGEGKCSNCAGKDHAITRGDLPI